MFWQKHVPVLGLDITSPPSPRGDGRLWGDGFEIETLIHMRVAAEGLRVAEVPSFSTPGSTGVDNLNAFSDGLRVLTTIVVERRRGRRRHRSRRRAPGHEPRWYRPAILSTWRRPSCVCFTSCTPPSTAAPADTAQDPRFSRHGPRRRPSLPFWPESSSGTGSLGRRPDPTGRSRPARDKANPTSSGARRPGSSRTTVVAARGRPYIHRRRCQRGASVATLKRRAKGSLRACSTCRAWPSTRRRSKSPRRTTRRRRPARTTKTWQQGDRVM